MTINSPSEMRMNPELPEAPLATDIEIDLLELWKVIWAGKWLIVSVTFFFAVASIIYALLQTNIYQAEAVLLPAEASQSGAGLASQFGGAAGLLGININGTGSDANNAVTKMRSREFVNQFISSHDLLPFLMASEWSDNDQRNVIDPDSYDEATQSWLPDGESSKPTDWDAYKAFSSIFSVSEDRLTGIVRVSIQWSDPVQAAQWVNWLVADINLHEKEHDRAEASSTIEYLRNQLQATQLVEMQRVFYGLIESQTRILMLADVRDEYVFQVVDRAVPPEDRISPNRKIICVIGTLLGVMLAIIYLFSRYFYETRIKKNLTGIAVDR